MLSQFLIHKKTKYLFHFVFQLQLFKININKDHHQHPLDVIRKKNKKDGMIPSKVTTYSSVLRDLKHEYKYNSGGVKYNSENIKKKEKCKILTKKIMLQQVNTQFYKLITERQAIINNQTSYEKNSYLVTISKHIRDSIRNIIANSEWMSVETRLAAYKKLNNIEFYILFPPETVSEYELLLNTVETWEEGMDTWLLIRFEEDLRVLKENNFLLQRGQLNEKMYREVPYDIVNAWYDPTQNTITIPPGITQWPVYHGGVKRYDLSSIGAVLGHELGHSIDNQGRYFDENGSWLYHGWWSEKDEDEFNKRIDCLANDYGHPCHSDQYGYHTMGEDMADQMGVRASLNVFLKETTKNDEYLRDFFIHYARIWCARNTENEQCNQVAQDVHALAKHRVDKTLRQLHQFSDIFQCKLVDNKNKTTTTTDKQGMINSKRCIVY